MRLRSSAREIDMINGAILPNLVKFAIPLMLSSVLQLLFNAADVVVVGRFEGSTALAAVGSTSVVTNLLINIFLGLSVGANVVIARHIGAGEDREASEATHTSVAISVIGGIAIAIFGFIAAEQVLIWMDTPETVLPLATLYVRIIFLGVPFNLLYNFGSAVLRSVGDTQRPMVYLTIAGVVNVVLNLIMVIVFRMGVAGVALATIASHALSSILVLRCLLRVNGVIHVDLRKLRVSKQPLKEIIAIGLPAGLQSALFNISNILIQSTINGFGEIVVAGNSVSQNIEGFSSAAMNAFYQAAMTFTSQNFGAQRYRRIRRITADSILLTTVVSGMVSTVILIFGRQLLGIYSSEQGVVEAGLIRLRIIVGTHFTMGIMNDFTGLLRGIGSTLAPMVVSILGACAFRIFWIYCILPFNPTLTMLYISYPISWILTGVVHAICFAVLLRRYPAELEKA